MSKADREPKSAPPAPAKSERLGAALRENLKRRKAQARGRGSADGDGEQGRARREGE
ncbi:MAG: hypothetical protein HKN60_00965 [Rhizobiales bacterium]|nr:hypothetical protein [Hyphomicrobiales bacterium]